MSFADSPSTRLATRLSFLVAGFGLASWGPLVPFAKARLAVDEGTLGLLLICLGIGSIVAMQATGVLHARMGEPTNHLGGRFWSCSVAALAGDCSHARDTGRFAPIVWGSARVA